MKGAFEVLAVLGFLLFLGYASLVGTSEPISSSQRETVDRAIDVIERKGFGGEAFLLRYLVRYRATDNWWNRRVGHESAYAATNFPFEVITLYSPFFDDPVDDVERAAVLLHESYHLFGYGEPGATARVWMNKRALGWNKEQYQVTKVWSNVRGYTLEHAPQMFECGPAGHSDCAEQ